MAKIRDYAKLAHDIVSEVGGESNIANATRCATRLRLVLKETPADAKEKISSMPGVITVVENNGQFQVVIGTHVGEVYQEVAEILRLDENAQAVEEPKRSILNRVIATMSAVFAPFIYVLAAAGILQGILILINLAAPSFAQTGTYEVLSFLSWTPFTFLPIFIAITASRHFKCSIYIAVLCCLALVNPTWTEMAARIAGGENISFLIFPLSQTTYTSSVLPPLFLVWILSYLERFLEKKLPDVVKPLLTPLICLVVMVPLTIMLIGPASTMLATGIANGYNALFDAAPAAAAAFIGGVWQIVVIFGVHWGITPVCLANFDMYGRDSFQAFQTIAVVAQMGAAFGVFLKTRNREFKGVALSAGVTGIFGITEPAIYGVTLRLKKPFICGCVAGAVGAVAASFFNTYYYVYAGLPGILTSVNAINADNPTSFIGEIIGCAIGIVGAIILVQFVGFADPKEERRSAVALKAAGNDGEKGGQTVKAEAGGKAGNGLGGYAADVSDAERGQGQTAENPGKPEMENQTAQRGGAAEGNTEIYSPLAGKVIPMAEVPDQVFSSQMMGGGVAVEPEDNKVYAPFDGEIVSIFDTKHAVGLKADTGAELLIHVGLDTVELKGQYFEINKKAGDRVKKGELILTFDAESIKAAGYRLVTPVIAVNHPPLISGKEGMKVTAGELLMTV